MGRLGDVFECENVEKCGIVKRISFAIRVDVAGKDVSLFETAEKYCPMYIVRNSSMLSMRERGRLSLVIYFGIRVMASSLDGLGMMQ